MGDHVSKRLRVSDSDMEERSFPNPFPDWKQDQGPPGNPDQDPDQDPDQEPDYSRTFGRDGKISPGFQKKVQSKIQDLLQQMEEGLKTADPHDSSAYTGWTGIALLYLQLHRVSGDPPHLNRALDHVKRALRTLNRTPDRTLNRRKVSFLCGDAGPLAVGAVVQHRLGNQDQSRDLLDRLLQLRVLVLDQDSDVPDEILYGRSGYLFSLLFVLKEVGPGSVDQDTVDQVVSAIVASGQNLSLEQKKSDRCPLTYEWHNKQYLGVAHGLAGILYMLLQPGSRLPQDLLTELVRPSLDYIRHKRFRSGNFPSSLSNESDRLVHWCHGAGGVLHLLVLGSQVFQEDKYLKEAVESADVVWQRGLLRKGYGICHGAAGNGYAFLTLYKLTRDPKHLYRACKFAEWCLDYGTHGCRIPDRPYSLFEGMAGTIHYLSELTDPESSRFPAFEL
ncbi:lanC-like protein 2 [Cololabis saira]|uniref:lanC-like protein 2 n=1 Tax=Cololabis saira TaxID=129043 RepID=UPI002AD3BBE0|nr:lanC-like protein 2 [Cololabis saira]